MRIMIEMNRNDLANLQTAVIVEMWDKKSLGRVRRAYIAEFTEQERVKISKLYPTLYAWHMRTGFPETATMHHDTILLLQRVANFFGTI